MKSSTSSARAAAGWAPSTFPRAAPSSAPPPAWPWPSTATAPSDLVRAGSADVLEALGNPHRPVPGGGRAFVAREQFRVLLRAPIFYPAFKQHRRRPGANYAAERGQRTLIFNFLGPLLNPAAPLRPCSWGSAYRELAESRWPRCCNRAGHPGVALVGDRKLSRAAILARKAHRRVFDATGERLCRKEFYHETRIHRVARTAMALENFPLQPARAGRTCWAVTNFRMRKSRGTFYAGNVIAA